MFRLVTFGCSYTFGQGLTDIYPHVTKPSKYAWGQLIADQLKLEHINNGKPGASNKEILNLILNFDYKEDDVVIVCWSHWDRWCVIKHDVVDQIGIWVVGTYYPTDKRLQGKLEHVKKNYPEWEKMNEAFFTHIHNTHDMMLDMQRSMQFANLWLSNKKIKNYHTMTCDENLHSYLKWFDVDIISTFQSTHYWKENQTVNGLNFGTAKDDLHPNEVVHQFVAEKILEHTDTLTK